MEIGKGKWEDSQFQDAPVAAHTRLAGAYGHQAYGGMKPTTGGTATVGWNRIELAADGRFTTSGGGGGFGAHVAVNSARPTQTGSYDLTGYRLTLNYDGGETKIRTLFMNPKDRGMIYLDGVAYLKQGK